jgi:hypothetical protein
MDQPAKSTVAQSALAIPEIVAEIFIYLIQERCGMSNFGEPSSVQDARSLLPCSRVNSLWWAEAMRYTWRYPTIGTKASLDLRLAKVHPSRRQFFAKFIKRAKIVSAYPGDFPWRAAVLRGLVFPKLDSLALCIDYSSERILLPLPRASNIWNLYIQSIRKVSSMDDSYIWGKTLRKQTWSNLPGYIKV